MITSQSEIITLTLTPQGTEAATYRKADPVGISDSDRQTFDSALREFDGSDNKLVNAAAELLAVCATISRQSPGDELNKARVELSRTIIDLKYKTVSLDYPPSVAENLCLLFAIVIDEFVMVSPWGGESDWGNRTLVADLFGFRDGGNRFYKISDRALMQPRALSEVLEIIYFFLKLGFRGKYTRGSEQERDKLIHRLEAALFPLNSNLDKQPLQMAGRPVIDSKTPVRRWTLRRKLLLMTCALAGLFVFALVTEVQQRSSSTNALEERRLVATAISEVDFVFSSQSGTTIERPRE